MRSNNIKTGIVTEALSNFRFKIEHEDDSSVQAYVSGKMRKNRIRVVLGDRVEYIVDELGPNNRISRRL